MRKMIGTFALITAVAALGSPAGASADLAPGDFKNVSKFCKALKKEMGAGDFAAAFGTNHNKRNAFGKCVSKKGVLPEPPAPSLLPCPEGPPPVTVPCIEPPLPVSAFGTAPASHDGKHKPKKSK
jgi:hypothetical protein